MKYFLAFLGIVALVVLVFILIVRGLTGGHKDAKAPLVTLSDYANTSTVMRLTVDGPIVADQDHRAVRVTVSRDQNMIEIISGYNGSVIQQQTFSNNQAAYTSFLKALQLMGYTKGNTTAALADERGYCATGDRFIYEIQTNGNSIQRFWYTSCGQGTFKGSNAAVRQLFRAQIPGYAKIAAGLGLQ